MLTCCRCTQTLILTHTEKHAEMASPLQNTCQSICPRISISICPSHTAAAKHTTLQFVSPYGILFSFHLSHFPDLVYFRNVIRKKSIDMMQNRSLGTSLFLRLPSLTSAKKTKNKKTLLLLCTWRTASIPLNALLPSCGSVHYGIKFKFSLLQQCATAEGTLRIYCGNCATG